jgi:hypothetical protein
MSECFVKHAIKNDVLIQALNAKFILWLPLCRQYQMNPNKYNELAGRLPTRSLGKAALSHKNNVANSGIQF